MVAERTQNRETSASVDRARELSDHANTETRQVRQLQ